MQDMFKPWPNQIAGANSRCGFGFAVERFFTPCFESAAAQRFSLDRYA
jgi:hypothetical protein